MRCVRTVVPSSMQTALATVAWVLAAAMPVHADRPLVVATVYPLYEFAREVVAAAGGDANAVTPIATSELQPPRPAPRPANSVLRNAVLELAGVPLLRDFRAPLRELVAALT